MEIRNLGKSGLRVSAVGLGTNNFGFSLDLEETKAVVHRALDLGITLIDTADIYGKRGGSETYLGQILGDRRKDIVLATKFGMNMTDDGAKAGGSRRYIMDAVEDSLRRLRTDWIDLYQIHVWDKLTPIEETMRALDDLVHQGKVRYLGCSNFAAWQMVESYWTAKAARLEHFVSCQDEYSLVQRGIEQDLLPAMEVCGVGLLPFRALASGLLTGKHRRDLPPPSDSRLVAAGRYQSIFAGDRKRYLTDHNRDVADRLDAFARERGHTLLDLSMSWMARQRCVASVLVGATKPDQLDANVDGVGWDLSAADMAGIEAIAGH